MTKDILLYETGDGGDITIIANDVALSETLYQQIYLALFGGNTEASTKGNELETQNRFDYWANDLFHDANKKRQFNSETEKVLKEVVLNSSGRLAIIDAVKKDLKFLDNIANVNIQVSILATDRLEILLQLSGLSNQEDREYQLIWNNSKSELIFENKV